MKLIVTSFSMQQKHSAPGMVLTSNTALLCLYLIQQWFIFLPKLRQCLGSVLSSQWTGYNAVVTAPWKMTHSNSVKFFISLDRSFILARSFITLDSFELGSEVDEWRPGDPILYQEPLIFLTITPWLLIGFCSSLSLHNTLFEVNQSAQTSTITHQSWDGSWQPVGRSPLTFRMQKLECFLPSPSLQAHSALKMTDFSYTREICCFATPCMLYQPPGSISSGWIPDDFLQINTQVPEATKCWLGVSRLRCLTWCIFQLLAFQKCQTLSSSCRFHFQLSQIELLVMFSYVLL